MISPFFFIETMDETLLWLFYISITIEFTHDESQGVIILWTVCFVGSG